MKMTGRNFLLLFLLLPVASSILLGLHEGDECQGEGEGGEAWVCTDLQSCPQAGDPRTTRPRICEFKGSTPIICCPPLPKPVLESSGMSVLYCMRQSMGMSCETTNFVKRDITHIVVGGRESKPRVHLHVAMIGYGPESSKEWLCGGTLISERYVLTAAHCQISHRLGEAKWIRLGELDSASDDDDAQPQDLQVDTFTPHPQYHNSTVYNDIALIKVNRAATFNKWVRPACLQTPDRALLGRTATAVGWGRTDFAGPTSDKLLEVDLSMVGSEKCGRQLGKSHRMPKGIDPRSMICAGEDEGGKDTCAGDSGGPLISTLDHACLKTVIGVTSFGRQCALPNTPGIYTRVSFYVPWIESIVWPSQT